MSLCCSIKTEGRGKRREEGGLPVCSVLSSYNREPAKEPPSSPSAPFFAGSQALHTKAPLYSSSSSSSRPLHHPLFLLVHPCANVLLDYHLQDVERGGRERESPAKSAGGGDPLGKASAGGLRFSRAGKKKDLYRRVGLGKGCTHRVGLLVSGKYRKHSKLLFSSGAVLASQFIRWEEISTLVPVFFFIRGLPSSFPHNSFSCPHLLPTSCSRPLSFPHPAKLHTSSLSLHIPLPVLRTVSLCQPNRLVYRDGQTFANRGSQLAAP